MNPKIELAQQKAVQAWQTNETSCIEMDVRLAKAFTDILLVEMYQPNLGCATTEELLNEIAARSDLKYRTIDN